MPVRVTAEEVKDIIDTELSDVRIEAFIQASHETVNKKLGDKSLGDNLLKEIERWLSAHYMTSFERQAIKEVAGPAEQEFADIYDKGLDSSTYGQTVKMLDPTGSFIDDERRTIKLKSIPE